MNKRTRIFAVVGALLALLVIAVAAVPMFFGDTIANRAKVEANGALTARVDWRDAGLSLFGDFPNLTLRLDDLSVAGTGRFAGDTLARVTRLGVVLDLASVLGNLRSGAPIVVRAVEINRPLIALKVLEDGTANWDIVKESAPKAEGSRPLTVKLRKLDISNASIALDDQKSRLVASLTGLRQSLSGDFGDEQFTLETDAHADSVSVRFAGIPYVNRVALDITAALDADMRTKKFTFAKNEIRLNDLRLGFSGSAIIGDENVALDLAFNTPRTDFRHILSLVPAIYTHDFQKLRTSGAVTVSGTVKGNYGERAFPSFAVNAKVNNGAFQYPDLPLPARDIALDLSVKNPGGHVDSTVVRLDRFHAVIGRNPIDGAMLLKTPVSDPDVDLRLTGQVDLADVGRTVTIAEEVIFAAGLHSETLFPDVCAALS